MAGEPSLKAWMLGLGRLGHSGRSVAWLALCRIVDGYQQLNRHLCSRSESLYALLQSVAVAAAAVEPPCAPTKAAQVSLK